VTDLSRPSNPMRLGPCSAVGCCMVRVVLRSAGIHTRDARLQGFDCLKGSEGFAGLEEQVCGPAFLHSGLYQAGVNCVRS